MTSIEYSAGLPGDSEIDTLTTGFSLEPIQRQLRQIVDYCKAQTQHVQASDRRIAELGSRIDELENERAALVARCEASEKSARAAHAKVGNFETDTTRTNATLKTFVAETVDAHVSAVTSTIHAVRRDTLEKLADFDLRLSADGVVIREVRAVAREAAAAEAIAKALAVRSELNSRLDDEAVRVAEALATAGSANETALRAREYVESHADTLQRAAASLQELRDRPIIAADVAALRERSRTAESVANAATAAVDALRSDFWKRLEALGAESAEALVKATAAVNSDRFEAIVETLRAETRSARSDSSTSLYDIRSQLAAAEAHLAQLAVRVDAVAETADGVSLVRSRVDFLESETTDAGTGLGAVRRAVELALATISGVQDQLRPVEGRVSRLEAQDYAVLRSAVANHDTRLDVLAASVSALPGATALTTSAEKIAAEVAQQTVLRRVSDAVAEEMMRVEGVLQSSVTVAVGESVDAAEARLKDAAASAELRAMVDGLYQAVQTTASSLQQLAHAVDGHQTRLESLDATTSEQRLMEREELRVMVTGLEKTATSLQQLASTVDGHHARLQEVETVVTERTSSAAAAIRPVSYQGGRARSPSPSSGRNARRARRVPAGQQAAAAELAAPSSSGSASRSATKRDDALRFSRLVPNPVEEY